MNISKTIDDIVAVLTDQRKPRYRHEKHVALLMFGMWLYHPADPDVLEHARIVAAATCYFDSGTKNPYVTIDNLANALLASPLDRPLYDIPNSLISLGEAVSSIYSFFLRCPPELKPSVNKALFFIESGGFNSDLEELKAGASSISTLKLGWSTFACTGPFRLASSVVGMDSILELFADENVAFKKADRILKQKDKLIKFFETANFLQSKIAGLLDTKSRKHLWVNFPKSLAFIACTSAPLSNTQLELLRKYRSPTASY